MKITRAQLCALQSLYSRFALAGGDGSDARAQRLAWASQNLGREVVSFRDLSTGEAATLIDTLKQKLGQPITPKPARKRSSTPRHKAVPVMAAPADLQAVGFWREQAALSPEAFDAWLAGPHSPTRGRRLLTVANCKAVVAALRSMIRRRASLKRAV